MIDPQTLATLTNFSTLGLAAALANGGYKGVSFKTAKFKGINNVGDFVYEAEYKDTHTGDLETAQVYLKYNHEMNSVSADY